MAFDVENGLRVFISTNSISGMEIPSYLAPVFLYCAIYEKTNTVKMPASDDTEEPIELTLEELQIYEGFYNYIGGDDLMQVVIEDDQLILYLPGVPFPLDLTPLSNGSFVYPTTGLQIWFNELEGEMIYYIGEFKSLLMGSRVNPELVTAGEDFEKWVGTYKPVTDEGHVSLASHAIVGIDKNGFMYMQPFYLHGMKPYVSLIPIGENLYYSGIEFSMDEEENIWLTYSGIRMLKEIDLDAEADLDADAE